MNEIRSKINDLVSRSMFDHPAGSEKLPRKSTAVCVLGMHRSGTSALSGLLNLAGVDFGQNLIRADKNNPKGYFENDDVWRVHHDLLKEIGSDWADIRNFDANWQQSRAVESALLLISEILKQDFSSKRLWGIKDPRMCRFFQLWQPLLENFDADPRIIIAVRHPLEVANSLNVRDGLSHTHGLALWLRYTLDAERDTRGLRRTVQDYSNLCQDWRPELLRLSHELQISLPELSPEMSMAIDSFLDGSLNHHLENKAAGEMSGSIGDWCIETYSAIVTMNRPESLETIDRIRSLFDRLESAATPYAEQLGENLSRMKDYLDSSNWLDSERVTHLKLLKEAEAEKQRFTQYLSVEQSKNIIQLEEERAEKQSLASALLQVQDHLTNVQAQLSRIQQSKSWRATKFFREALWRLRQFTERAIETPNEIDAELPIEPETVVPALPVMRPIQKEACNFPNLRILIVTPDLHGPIQNGGIGTAFAEMAKQLSAWSANFTLAYALGDYTETRSLTFWKQYYRELGINLLPLNDCELENEIEIDAPDFRQVSWRIFRWLKRCESSFDLVIFPEWMGLAYYSLLAKGQGLAFQDLEIAINTHSPEAWAVEGNRDLPNDLNLAERDFMERECVRRADWLISPSQYILEWMRGRNWVLPEKISVIQNLISNYVDMRAPFLPAQLKTLVFFGRLEHRKGLELFCDAIEKIRPELRRQLKSIRFFGKVVLFPDGNDSRRYIMERAQNWGIEVNILADLNKDQALAELSQPGLLAVIASLSENSPYTVLECLHHGIHFIAARVGGIPELVEPEDAEACLFHPSPPALAKSLERIILHGMPIGRLAQSKVTTKDKWYSWFCEVEKAGGSRLERKNRTDQILKVRPLVSICLVHYNRPEYLRASLASIREQTYSKIEVVLVDDGSPSVEAQNCLDELEIEFLEKNWQIIRQQNEYLGAARNRAAAAARGKYLLFMDDDNIAMPHEVETFLTAIEHSDADIVTCPSALFSDKVPDEVKSVWLPLGGAAGAGVYRNVFGDANSFWTKSAYEKFGGYTTDYGLGNEDWELFASAVLSGAKLELLPIPVFWYRVSPDSMLRRGNLFKDYARSARAYLRHDPSGLGLACSYAAFLSLKEHAASLKMKELNVPAVPTFSDEKMSNGLEKSGPRKKSGPRSKLI